MMHMENRRRLCVLLLILNLAFIWGNSMLSAEQSQAFSDWVKALLSRPFGSGGSESGGSGTLRKVAHFSEFASLGGTFGVVGFYGRGAWNSWLGDAALWGYGGGLCG